MASMTLTQFERIDGLFNACLRRPALEQAMSHPLASQDYLRTVYFRSEWELTSACVEVVGYEAFNDFASPIDCAASILTTALTSSTFVIDEMETAQ